MKKYVLLFSFLFCLFTVSFTQSNKVDKNGNRKGEWKIYYKVESNKFYDLLELIPNWHESVQEVDKNLDATLFEKVKYKNGKKEGPFEILVNKERKGTKTYGIVQVTGVNYNPTLVKGEYRNGLINGDLEIFDLETEKLIIKIQYENGIIKDQELHPSEYLINKQQLPTKFAYFFNNEKFHPKIRFQDGICVEQIGLNKKRDAPLKIFREQEGFFELSYNVEGTSSYFLNLIKYDNKLVQNGFHIIREATKKLFDTSGIVRLKLPYLNGKTHGVRIEYNKYGGLFSKQTYKNGDKNGLFTYYLDNETILLEANFKNGLLNGEYVIYYNSKYPNLIFRGPLCLTNKTANSTEGIVDFKNDLDYSKERLKKEGFKFNISEKFILFRANYLNGRIDSDYSVFDAKNNKIYQGKVSECRLENYEWYNNEGKVITNKEKDSEKIYYIKWDMTYTTYICVNPGCKNKETCPHPRTTASNIPFPEDHWILETRNRPDNRCSRMIAYVDPVDWTICNNRNYRKCNKKKKNAYTKKDGYVIKFSAIELEELHKHKGYKGSVKEFFQVCEGGFGKRVKENLSDYYRSNNWYEEAKLRHGIK